MLNRIKKWCMAPDPKEVIERNTRIVKRTNGRGQVYYIPEARRSKNHDWVALNEMRLDRAMLAQYHGGIDSLDFAKLVIDAYLLSKIPDTIEVIKYP